eukprot:CAMPEP_0114669086 /NCGR_PEP_ID=MMETSP0191-20121206/37499_1 /TAXON_ID=126664 /ORGANISM="Sorites sp." /LENGTH=357 /DNA_ID=CAMNT_0001923963 /DNA_START=33 /DNA_END=1106 /DNA_ORIENTATION=+
MAVTEVPRRPGCSSKSFKNVSRGPSLETTTAGSAASVHSAHTLASSCECNASPVLDTSSTLVFVDWDDTLFPSTDIFDRWGLQLRSAVPDHLDAEQERLLKMWRKSLQRFMKAMAEFAGHCAIVTNAEIMWVEDCLQRFAPEVLQLTREAGGPTILHAKDILRSMRSRKHIWQHDEISLPARHLDVYREDDIQHFKYVEMTAAKYQAMKLEFHRVFDHRQGMSRCNVINFGDMEYEHEAVLELGMRLCELPDLQEPHIKSFLLPEAPRITELALRLDLLRMLLPAIVRLDGDISLNLKEWCSDGWMCTPMALLSKALRIPDLQNVEMPHAFGLGEPPTDDEVADSLQEVAAALASGF